jgi:hypothetical protein
MQNTRAAALTAKLNPRFAFRAKSAPPALVPTVAAGTGQDRSRRPIGHFCWHISRLESVTSATAARHSTNMVGRPSRAMCNAWEIDLLSGEGSGFNLS